MNNSTNILINDLINATPKQIKDVLNRHYPEEIIGQYVPDIVPEDDIIRLLNRSCKIKDLQYFLIALFFAIEPQSVTDNVLEVCLNYPGRFRKTLLGQLAHNRLSEKQLLKLNENIDTPEAFYKLFLMYLAKKDMPDENFSRFLIENKRHLSALSGYKERLPSSNFDCGKIAVTDDILSQFHIN